MLSKIHHHARENLVGYLALFVALSGTAVAASGELARNSVGTAELRRAAVTGRKVARHTLTGANIKSATLGTVPNATRVGGLPPSALQSRVTGTCQVGSAISKIDPAGTVACQSTGARTLSDADLSVGLDAPTAPLTLTVGQSTQPTLHISGNCGGGRIPGAGRAYVPRRPQL